MKKVLVPLAEGFEEIEAVTIIDILRRAGAQVTTVGLQKRNVEGSHGIKMVADSVLADEVEKDWDLVALPGGVPGAPNLGADDRLVELLKRTAEKKQVTAAVCAAPWVLEKAGLTKSKNVTSHPNWADSIVQAHHTGRRVEVDGSVITGLAAGSVMEFAFQLVETLFGKDKVDEVNQGVLARI